MQGIQGLHPLSKNFLHPPPYAKIHRKGVQLVYWCMSEPCGGGKSMGIRMPESLPGSRLPFAAVCLVRKVPKRRKRVICDASNGAPSRLEGLPVTKASWGV
jgi:hypothetical protein